MTGLLDGIPLGHVISSHRVLGWCAWCAGRSVVEELGAWQVWAMANVPAAADAVAVNGTRAGRDPAPD